jgi:hypothetical protein
MTPEQEQALQAHIKAIAQILYDDTPREELTTLSGIENAVRRQMQKHVMPEVGVFLSQQKPIRPEAISDTSKASSATSRLRQIKPKS